VETFYLFGGILTMLGGVGLLFLRLHDEGSGDHAPDYPNDHEGRSPAERKARRRSEGADGISVFLFGLLLVLVAVPAPSFVRYAVGLGFFLTLALKWVWAARAGRVARAREAAAASRG
jgi:hypothetical protein